MAIDQELDQAKRGLRYTEPGISMFGAARSTEGLLPEMMQLGQVMRMRGAMDRDALELRGLHRDEDAEIAASDEYDKFSDFLTTVKDATPVERAKAIQGYQTQNPASLGNKYIDTAIKGLGDVSGHILDEKKNAVAMRQADSDMADLDFHESTRKVRQEAATQGALNALNQARSEGSAYKAAIEAREFDDVSKLGSFAAGLKHLDPNTQELVAVLGDRFKGEEDRGKLQGVQNVMQGFASASKLEDSYASELQEYAPMLFVLKSKGVTIDPSMPEAELEAQIAKGLPLAGNNKAGYEKMAGAMRQAAATSATVKSVADQFKLELPQIVELASKPETMQQAKDMLTRWNVRASKFTGLQDAEIERRSQQFEAAKQGLTLRKMLAEITNSEGQAKKDADVARRAEMGLKLRQRQAEIGEDKFNLEIIQMLREENAGKYRVNNPDDPKEVAKANALLEKDVEAARSLIAEQSAQVRGKYDVKLK